VILEGGSSALGAWGYVLAVEELWEQLPEDWREGSVTLAYACGSGGTGAGIELGVRRVGWRGARPLGFAVCNDAEYFREAISGICIEAKARWAMDAPRRETDIAVDDGFIGPGYALATDEGLEVIRRVARADGVVLDPVYTGKAMQGLIARRRERSPSVADRAVFIHTGGAFGLFPFAARLAAS
jgi:D-cysteine desulfhydrase